MKLGYTILYVASVADTIAFYEAAFGLTRAMITETGEYGELSTGETTLAFSFVNLGCASRPPLRKRRRLRSSSAS